MADKKKLSSEEIKNENIKNEVLTDEQANDAAGGIIFRRNFTCGDCGKTFSGQVYSIGNGKGYCEECYRKIIENA